VIIESMKMQTELFASRDGVIDRVTYRVGESFERNAPLVMLKPSGAEG
jgi:biotin carboxyl carrier protein